MPKTKPKHNPNHNPKSKPNQKPNYKTNPDTETKSKSADSPDIIIPTDVKHLDLPARYAIEMNRNCSYSKVQPSNELALYIHSNFDTMSETELQKTALKCLTLQNLQSIVLGYELAHYRCTPKEMKIAQFTKKAIAVLKRYQHRAGGFMIEDPDWYVYQYPCTNHHLKKNEVLFLNTMNYTDMDQPQTEEYLDMITEQLESIAPNILIKIRYKEHEYSKTVHILIWCYEKKIHRQEQKSDQNNSNESNTILNADSDPGSEDIIGL